MANKLLIKKILALVHMFIRKYEDVRQGVSYILIFPYKLGVLNRGFTSGNRAGRRDSAPEQGWTQCPTDQNLSKDGATATVVRPVRNAMSMESTCLGINRAVIFTSG